MINSPVAEHRDGYLLPALASSSSAERRLGGGRHAIAGGAIGSLIVSSSNGIIFRRAHRLSYVGRFLQTGSHRDYVPVRSSLAEQRACS